MDLNKLFDDKLYELQDRADRYIAYSDKLNNRIQRLSEECTGLVGLERQQKIDEILNIINHQIDLIPDCPDIRNKDSIKA